MQLYRSLLKAIGRVLLVTAVRKRICSTPAQRASSLPPRAHHVNATGGPGVEMSRDSRVLFLKYTLRLAQFLEGMNCNVCRSVSSPKFQAYVSKWTRFCCITGQ